MERSAPANALQALRDIGELLADLTGTAWSALSHQELLAALAVTPSLRNQFDAVAGQIAVASEQGAVQSDGARRAATWAGENTSAEPAEVRRDVMVTKWLADYRQFADAYEAGILSREHVNQLRKAESPVTRSHLVADQDMLIGFAKTLGFKDFGVALQYWINGADPDGTIPDRQLAENDFWIRRGPDGSAKFGGQLDPLMGTAVFDAVESAFNAAATADDQAGLKRSRSERQAQVLAGLVVRGATRQGGTAAHPLFHIVLGQRLAEQLLARMADDNVVATPNMNDPDFRCEFIDGTPVHPSLAAAALGVATIRRIVFGADSRVLDVSHNARKFPTWMRQSGLVASRGRCDEAGCDARLHWLHADHHVPHSKDGATAWENLRMLCSESNRDKADRSPNEWNYRRRRTKLEPSQGVAPPLFVVPPPGQPVSDRRPADPDDPDPTDDARSAA